MMQNPSPKFNYFGIISGALLLILGLYIVLSKTHQNKGLAWFLVVYGAFRLGLAIYTIYFRKNKNEQDPA
ncbi:MAG: hypothetical protein ACOYLG_12710 [Chitinophagaceae bacterium]|jgi:hypothetical protein